MTLREWVDANASRGRTIGMIAGELGCSRSTLYDWMSGRQMPRPAKIRRIVSVTRGAVTAAEILMLTVQAEAA